MVCDNVALTQKYSSIPDSIQAIVATYRVRYVFDEERIIIPLDEYELRLKEKQREEKINKIL
jgi:hypothetical protein